jgi:DegV family protein with EDD domain
MAVAVVTDTTHYLAPELIAAHEVHEVSLYVNWEGRQMRESEISDYDEFYTRLRSAPDLPTTSQPSIGDFISVYEPLLDAGHDIVSIHLAAGMSGTCQAALQARAQLDEQRSAAGRIEVIDSATACGGLGCLVLAASGAARAGAGLEGVVDSVHRAREALRIWFCIDTLEYLHRGGRIATAQKWLGSALRIKPILTVESEITPVERVRTAAGRTARGRGLLRGRRQGHRVRRRDQGRGGGRLPRVGAARRHVGGRDRRYGARRGLRLGRHPRGARRRGLRAARRLGRPVRPRRERGRAPRAHAWPGAARLDRAALARRAAPGGNVR